MTLGCVKSREEADVGAPGTAHFGGLGHEGGQKCGRTAGWKWGYPQWGEQKGTESAVRQTAGGLATGSLGTFLGEDGAGTGGR